MPAHTRRAGFSLLEVLVALAVAAILATSLLGLIQQNVTMANEAWEVQAHLDMAQELLLTRSPYSRLLAATGWTAWSGGSGSTGGFGKSGATRDQDARWKLTREQRKQLAFRHGFEDAPANATFEMPPQMLLSTSVRGRSLLWKWLEPPASAGSVQGVGRDATPSISTEEEP